MAKAILICGKICSGKTTYARRIQAERCAVLLSVDEIMLALFGQHSGEKHDVYGRGIKRYLLQKSLEFLEVGVDVVLDWGFWSKAERRCTRAFYAARQIPCVFHYLDVPASIWAERLQKRNTAVLQDGAFGYVVDAPLAAKFQACFEAPEREEIDVWVTESE